MIRQILTFTLLFLFLIALQVLVLNNIQLGGYLNPYLYVLFVLLLPFDTPKWLLLIVAELSRVGPLARSFLFCS